MATPRAPDSRFVAGFGRSKGRLKMMSQTYRPHRIWIEQLVRQVVGDQSPRFAAVAVEVTVAAAFGTVAETASRSESRRSSLRRSW